MTGEGAQFDPHDSRPPTLLWTVMPSSMVMAGWDRSRPARREVHVEGRVHLVEGDRLERIISTDPMDFLNPDLMPGSPYA